MNLLKLALLLCIAAEFPLQTFDVSRTCCKGEGFTPSGARFFEPAAALAEIA
jgi:hypothetical protein